MAMAMAPTTSQHAPVLWLRGEGETFQLSWLDCPAQGARGGTWDRAAGREGLPRLPGLQLAPPWAGRGGGLSSELS